MATNSFTTDIHFTASDGKSLLSTLESASVVDEEHIHCQRVRDVKTDEHIQFIMFSFLGQKCPPIYSRKGE
ncbi:MAG: hypothetical protein ACOVQN_05690 [Exiguobacterium sp.]